MDTSIDTKNCPRCGRALPVAEFFSETLGLTSECRECAWEQLFQRTEADVDDLFRTAPYEPPSQRTDFDVFRRGYRRYQGGDRDKILERLHRRFVGHERPQRLSTQAEAGYVGFAAQMRKRRARRHVAGGWHTVEDVKRLYEEQGGRCFYCGTELDGKYHLDHKTPLSRGGTDWPENLSCACDLCHSRKEEMTAEEFVEYLINLRRRS